MSRFDKLKTARPVNKEAALVTSAGISWDPKIPISCPHDSEMPIPFEFMPHGLKDLRGLRFGRLTVLGYFGRKKKGKGTEARHRWVVRCDCGMYTVRRQTSLVKPRTRDDDDCCDRCKHLDRIRRQ